MVERRKGLSADERLAPGSPVAGQAYFVTNGEPMPFFEFAERMIAHWGYPPITGKVPYWLAYAVASVAEFWDTLKGGTLNATVQNSSSRATCRRKAIDRCGRSMTAGGGPVCSANSLPSPWK